MVSRIDMVILYLQIRRLAAIFHVTLRLPLWMEALHEARKNFQSLLLQSYWDELCNLSQELENDLSLHWLTRYF